MAIFKINKTDNYTIMSNQHLRNKELSLKAKRLVINNAFTSNGLGLFSSGIGCNM